MACMLTLRTPAVLRSGLGCSHITGLSITAHFLIESHDIPWHTLIKVENKLECKRSIKFYKVKKNAFSAEGTIHRKGTLNKTSDISFDVNKSVKSWLDICCLPGTLFIWRGKDLEYMYSCLHIGWGGGGWEIGTIYHTKQDCVIGLWDGNPTKSGKLMKEDLECSVQLWMKSASKSMVCPYRSSVIFKALVTWDCYWAKSCLASVF